MNSLTGVGNSLIYGTATLNEPNWKYHTDICLGSTGGMNR